MYRRCRDSVDEFKSISKEVRDLHIVLEAIHSHWQQNPLASKHRQNLVILSDGCVETLHQLEAVLNSHESLGMQKRRMADRWTWVAKNLAPIRNELLTSALSLSMFNNTVTYAY